MCGIIGIQCNGRFPRDTFVRMLKDSADRGQDSTGVAGITLEGEVFFHRALGNVENWMETIPPNFWDMFDKALFILGVTRAQPVPEGDSIRVENRQPILYGDWLGVHNGTIGNDRELKAQYGFQVKSQIDSEVALALLDHKFNGSIESIQDWASELSGGMAIIAFNVKTWDWVAIKNFKPLCFAYADDGVVVWASERKTLEIGGFGDIRWVPPYTGFLNVTFRHFDIDTLHETFVPMADENKAIVVASGGIDSSTAAYIAKKLHDKEVTLLHFDYGQIAREREWEAVCAVSEALDCSKMQVDISWLGRLVDTPLVSSNVELPLGIKSVETTGCWVPARNLIMLSIAAGICESLGIGSIYSGFNQEECLLNDPCNMVRMWDGSRKMPSEVSVGDELKSWEFDAKKIVKTVVEECKLREVDSYYIIRTKGRIWKDRKRGEFHEYKVSGSHPFFVKGRGWVKAQDLLLDDVLYRYTEGVQSERTSGEGNYWYGRDRSGSNNPAWGSVHPHSEETKARLREIGHQQYYGPGNEALRERVGIAVSKAMTPEVRRRMSESLKRFHKKRVEAGIPHWNTREEFRQRMSKIVKRLIEEGKINPANNLPKPTSLERLYIKFMEKYNLPFRYVGDGQVWFTANGRHMNPDFIDLDTKRVVEVWCDWWHSDEEMEERRRLFGSLGWEMLDCHERELDDHSFLLEKLGINETVVNGHKVISVERIEGGERVYNWHCTPYNNYFIGKGGALTHNSGCYPDNDVEFLKVFNLALKYGTLRRPKLILALERIMKPEIIRLGNYLKVPYHLTWSCDQGFSKPCGQCGCCWMRQFAFSRAEVVDEQVYLKEPLEKAPWYGAKTSEVAPLEDILRRVQQRGLEDLIKI